MKKIVGLFFILVLSLKLHAQQSYIYLEPIKGLPCKIFINQVEINALTKNYFLIPLKGNGEYTFDVVFGGGLHPKQTFIVDVVEGSGYAYKLAKTVENKFYLLDLVNNGKIIETNTATNLGLTTEDNLLNFFDPKMQKPEELSRAEERRRAKLEKAKAKAKSLEKVELEPKIENPKKEEYGVVEVITSQSSNNAPTPKAVGNTKCASLTSPQEVESFVDRLNQKNDDESKLILIRKKNFTGCLTCSQVYKIVDELKTQYGRFSAIKLFNASISDPENITQLESLFKTESYKSRLREL